MSLKGDWFILLTLVMLLGLLVILFGLVPEAW